MRADIVLRLRITKAEHEQLKRVAEIRGEPLGRAVGYHVMRVIAIDGLAPDISKLGKIRKELVKDSYED